MTTEKTPNILWFPRPVTVGAELPDIVIPWLAEDLSSGYTFSTTIVTIRVGVDLDLGLTVTPTYVDPDTELVVVVPEGAFDGLTPGSDYEIAITPKRTSDGKDREPARAQFHAIAGHAAAP